MISTPSLKVVVVGAGPAGARCAERLAGGGASVTLVGGEAAHPYNRVALSQYLAGDVEEAALVTHHPDRLGEHRIAWRPDTTVAALDRAGGAAVLAGGRAHPLRPAGARHRRAARAPAAAGAPTGRAC